MDTLRTFLGDHCGSMSLTPSKVGVVVPTLGNRPEYLIDCLNSIRQSENAHILLVSPDLQAAQSLVDSGLVDTIVEDPGGGASSAISAGILNLPLELTYVTWLGDDDKLKSRSLEISSEFLDRNPACSAVFGTCIYVTSEGKEIWRNIPPRTSFLRLATRANRLPQPGSIFRRSAYDRVGGLNKNLKFAFDQDLFTRLSRVGELKIVEATLAEYRWHSGSLSGGQQRAAMVEAMKVRSSHLIWPVNLLMRLWEWPRISLAMALGSSLDKRAKKSESE